MTNIDKTDDLGFTEIEIAKVGDYTGSLPNNGGVVEQHFTEESLKNVVEKANKKGEEILLDQQHKSFDINNTDDRACGWIKDLYYKAGSIFGKCFWTELGLNLIRSRIFRFISPVFSIGEDGQPTELINVALTNSPAITDINPVINSKINEVNMEKENTENVTEVTVTENTDQVTEEKEPVEVKEENTEPEDLKKYFENYISSEEFKEMVTNTLTEIVKNNETVEEVKEEPVEVIKIEALNSKPIESSVLEPAWQKLSGKAFIDFINKGKLN